jgi:GATA-binding protein
MASHIVEDAAPHAPLEALGAQASTCDDLDVASIVGSHVLQTAFHPHNAYSHPYYDGASSTAPSIAQSQTPATSIDGILDLSPGDEAVRKGVLRQTYFPAWRNDSGGVDETPEEMQQRDPLQLEVWKLYSKAKTQLPNADRMQNLTWRMMSMNLRRLELERERQRGCVAAGSYLNLCHILHGTRNGYSH